MELTTELTIAAPADRVWPLLSDVERVAPCLPGAALTRSDGDDHEGEVTVKVGPIRATYEGTAHVTERSDGDRRLVVDARGRDRRSGSTASAVVRAQAHPEGTTGTRVTVDIDLSLTGRIAQFGRGALADVTHRLAQEMGANLERALLGAASDNGTGTAAEAGRPGSGGGDALDLGRVAGPWLRRAATVAAALAARAGAGVAAAVLARRRRRC